MLPPLWVSRAHPIRSPLLGQYAERTRCLLAKVRYWLRIDVERSTAHLLGRQWGGRSAQSSQRSGRPGDWRGAALPAGYFRQIIAKDGAQQALSIQRSGPTADHASPQTGWRVVEAGL